MGNIFNDFELLDFINLDEIVWDAAGIQSVALSSVAGLSISGYTPSCYATGVIIPKATISLAGYAPTLEETAHIPAVSLSLAAYAPECGSFVSTEITTAGHLVLTAYTPTQTGSFALVQTCYVVINGYAPGCVMAQIEAETGHITLTGYNPTYILRANIPQTSIVLAGHNPLFGPGGVIVPSTGIVLTGHAPTFYQTLNISGVAHLILTGHAPAFGPAAVIIPKASGLELTAYAPTQSWALSVNARYKMQTIYLCILTGAADGLTDLEIPISSFQSTLRDGEPSYLACVIPNSIDYIAGIAARTNGDIVIRKGYRLYDGSRQTEEICRVDYESLQIARGANSDSETISGHKTTRSSSPKSVTLEEVSYYGLQTDGKRTFRALPDLFLRVGDTAVYGADSLVVGQISYIVDAQLAIMQVTEA